MDFTDPVLRALKDSPFYRRFLRDNRESLSRLVRDVILRMYASSERPGRLSPPSPAAAPPRREGASARVSADVYARTAIRLAPLPPPRYSSFRGGCVAVVGPEEHALTGLIRARLAGAGIECVMCDTAGKDYDALRRRLEQVRGRMGASCRGCVFVAPPFPAELLADDPEEAYALSLAALHALLAAAQSFHPVFAAGGRKGRMPFFAVLTRGAFAAGRANHPLMCALHSAVGVLPSAYERKAVVKAVDVAVWDEAAVDRVFSEVQAAEGWISVGYRADGTRLAWEWVREESGTEVKKDTGLDPGDVVLAVGGGTGITAECVEELARDVPCTFVLAGRTPLEMEDWCAGLVSTSLSGSALARRVAALLPRAGRKPSAAAVENTCRRVERVRAVRAAMERIRRRGARVHYVACDVTRGEDLAAVIDMILRRYGRLDAVVYGAGVDRSKSLLMKDPDSFEETVRPKILGVLNLFRSLRSVTGLKKVVLFSSFYAWHGMQGSMDYIAGNRFTGECAPFFSRLLPGVSVTAVYWGPWEAVGMAGTDYLRKYFSSHGIEMISPAAGRRAFRAAFAGGETETAVVRLTGRFNAADAFGISPDRAAAAANRFVQEHRRLFPFIDRVLKLDPGRSVTAFKKFCFENDLYLPDHVFDGVPIVPGVMGMELMVETARLLFPDYVPLEARDIRFHAPFHVTADRPALAFAEAEVVEKGEDEAVVSVSLSELAVDGDGTVSAVQARKFTSTVRLGTREKRRARAVDVYVEELSGLRLFLPIEICNAMCEDVAYHFGPVMLGEVDGVFISQKRCATRNAWRLNPLRNAPEDVVYSINPLPIDMSMQGILKHFPPQHFIRVIPSGCTYIRWGENSEGMREFSTRTQASFIDVEHRRAGIDCSVFDAEGNVAVSLRVETFIRNRVEPRPVLFECFTAETGTGSLPVSIECARLSLFAVDRRGMDHLRARMPAEWIRECDAEADEDARRNWLASRAALLEAFEQFRGSGGGGLELLRNGSGYLVVRVEGAERRPAGHVSLSHSHGWGFAGVCGFPRRIGVDVEHVEEKGDSFARQFLDGEERKILAGFAARTAYREGEAAVIAFSCKEAAFKAGSAPGGLRDIRLRAMDTDGTAEFLVEEEGGREEVTVHYLVFDHKVLSVCIRNEGRRTSNEL